jgi:predicted helicase
VNRDYTASFEARLADLRDDRLSDDDLHRKYAILDNSDWKLASSRLALRNANDDKLLRCAYRPFDDRWCWFGPEIMDRPRRELMYHVAGRDNVCLNVVRQTKQSAWGHALVSALPTPPTFIEMKDGSNVFPLSLYHEHKIENICPKFRAYLAERYDHNFTAEEILGFIYAVLHAPTCRERYNDFLRMDFPRIPFPGAAVQFEALSRLGWQLVQAHLLRDVPHAGLANYHGKGDHTVEKPRYDPLEQAIHLNATQYLAPVPLDVWDFHIGGYQVIAKYLKSRAGRRLSLDEIEHVANVADCLAFTIDQMQRIDAAYLAAFSSGGK